MFFWIAFRISSPSGRCFGSRSPARKSQPLQQFLCRFRVIFLLHLQFLRVGVGVGPAVAPLQFYHAHCNSFHHHFHGVQTSTRPDVYARDEQNHPVGYLLCCCASCFFLRSLALRCQHVCFLLQLLVQRPVGCLLCCCASCFFLRSLALQFQQVCFLLMLLLRHFFFPFDLLHYFLCHVLHFLFWRRLFLL